MSERDAEPGEAGPLRREEDDDGGAGSPMVPCDLCGAPVLERHCKIVCRNCGYMRDCSDP